jgi:hypothetical protein
MFYSLLIIFITFIILIIIISTIQPNKNEHFNQLQQHKVKPYLWVYWENKKDKVMPDYIKLCRQSILKHCSKSFNVVELDEKNIYHYLPELKEKEKDYKLDKLIIAHKVDYYRILLLNKYGGLYVDADIIMLRDPIEIIDKLNDYDFVGFGCTGNKCTYGYGEPSNWVLASRPKGRLIDRVLHNIENKLKAVKDNIGYHDLGKLVIWEELKYLKETEDYKYYHYPSRFDGARDKNGEWVTDERLFSNEQIEYDTPNEMLFVVLYNSEMQDIPKTTIDELLHDNTNFAKIIKKSLNI